MQAIIPSPVSKTAFNIFPIPKSLSIAKIVIQIEIISPTLELAKIRENKKKRSVNKFKKNKTTKNETLGSVK